MKAAGTGGAIVNIASVNALRYFGNPSYSAAKAGIISLTQSIASEYGPIGIRCNAICPGWIMTGMVDAAFAVARDPEKAKQDALARHAAGRFGTPDDIARAAVWLASDDAAFATGQTFTIDGGLTAASPLRPALF